MKIIFSFVFATFDLVNDMAATYSCMYHRRIFLCNSFLFTHGKMLGLILSNFLVGEISCC